VTNELDTLATALYVRTDDLTLMVAVSTPSGARCGWHDTAMVALGDRDDAGPIHVWAIPRINRFAAW
jgi:hypothetical protein